MNSGLTIYKNSGILKQKRNSMFKVIPIYPKYEISEDGVIRNSKTKKILKQKFQGGYHSVGVYDAQVKVKYHNTHRLVAMAWIEIPYNYENLQVAHNDGNAQNNHYTNLRWTTAKENVHDKYKHNSFNSKHGEQHHNRKLNDDVVISLRREIKETQIDCKALSVKHGIPRLTVYDCVTGRSWKHLNEKEAPVSLAGTQYKRN